MSDELTSRVRSDFSRARFKAFLNGVWAALPVSNVIALALIYLWSKRELGRLPEDAVGN